MSMVSAEEIYRIEWSKHHEPTDTWPVEEEICFAAPSLEAAIETWEKLMDEQNTPVTRIEKIQRVDDVSVLR